MAVCEAARLAGVRRLVFISSVSVYDRNMCAPDAALAESLPLGPRSLYGSTKVAAETLVRAYTHRGWLEGVILRFPAVYGYGRFRGGSKLGFILQQVVLQCLKGRGATLPPDMGTHEYLYAADGATAVCTVLEARRLAHTVYNIGTGQVHTPGEVAHAVEVAVPGARVDFGPAGERQHPLDVSRAAAELGFSTRFALADGIRDLAQRLTQCLAASEKAACGNG